MLKNKIMLKKIKIIIISIIFFNFSFVTNAKSPPESFADLAEKLMISVVNSIHEPLNGITLAEYNLSLIHI